MNKNRKIRNNNNNQGIVSIVRRQGGRKRQAATKVSVYPEIIMKNIMSAKSFTAVKVQTTVSTSAGSTLAIFGSTGAGFWNIGNILNTSLPFQDSAAKYTLFRITGIKIDVQRIIPQSGTQISGVFLNGTIPPLFSLFAPTYTSTNPLTALPQCSAAVEFDPFVESRQRASFSIEPIFAYSNSSTQIGNNHLYGMWNILSATNFINMPGSMQILFPAYIAAALTTSVLYTYSVTVNCEFACDYA